jgi:putative transposase
MPRRPRFATGGHLFHVLNRSAGRRTIFEHDGDYLAFERLLAETAERFPLRLLAYVVLPNHWHLVVWPVGDDDLSATMHWLTAAHATRWQTAHDTVGTGPLYQGRFKSFPIESDDHFYTVCRYVERNPLRANLVQQAEAWRYSSLWQWHNEHTDVPLDHWPLPRPAEWLEHVNAAQTEAELAALRTSVTRGVPFGHSTWRRATALQLGLPATRGLQGRPPS